MAFDLSIIICTYDRYGIVERAVERLLSIGGFDPATQELLVIDNTPSAKREALSFSSPHVRIEICPVQGLSHARNFGIEHSAAPIIAFLDDDAFVCEGWCQKILARFRFDAALSVVGGKVVPKYESTTLPVWYAPDLAGYLSCIDWDAAPRYLHPNEWIVGANMFYRREVFEQFGMFNATLGRKGTLTLMSNEETELHERIGISNVFYDPEPVVEHLIPPTRLTLEWFRKRVYWQAVSDMVAGNSSTDLSSVRTEYGKVAAALAPTQRNINIFSFAPHTYAEFSMQLRAIYLVTILLGGGMPSSS